MSLIGTEQQEQASFNSQPLYPEGSDIIGLNEPFSQEEIHNAVMSLAKNKASGPDGLPAELIQMNWEVLAPDIISIVQDFYNLQIDLTPMNKAHIVLVPKGSDPSNMADYRPISVINLIPKLISKVLVNRLKYHLP
jgi:hypothetical protein